MLLHFRACLGLAFAFSPIWAQERFIPFDGSATELPCQEAKGQVFQVQAWTQVTGSERLPDGRNRLKGFVRVALFGGEEAFTLFCPLIRIDGKTDKMYSRLTLNPNSRCFPISVCEYPVHADMEQLKVVLPDGTEYPVPSLPSDPKTIAVVGQTGCPQGSCSGGDWHFAEVAEDLARQNPALVFHLGNARKTQAPCESATCTDTWQAWLYEFFAPAQALLATAPLVMVRGEGETCDLGGNGWFYLFHPDRASNNNQRITCATDPPATHAFTAPWYFDLGQGEASHRFLVVDSANGREKSSEAHFEVTLDRLLSFPNPVSPQNTTLLTHLPLWSTEGRTWGSPLESGFAKSLTTTKEIRFTRIQSGGLPAYHALLPSAKERVHQWIIGHGGSFPVTMDDEEKLSKQEKDLLLWRYPYAGYDLWQANPEDPTGWSLVHRFLTDKGPTKQWRTLVAPAK